MHQLIRFFFFFLLLASYGDMRASTTCSIHNIAVVVDSSKLVNKQQYWGKDSGITGLLSDFLVQLKSLSIGFAMMSCRVYHSNSDCFTNRTLSITEHFPPTTGSNAIRQNMQKLKYYNSSDSFNSTCAKGHLFSQYKEFKEHNVEGFVGMIIAAYASVKEKFTEKGQYGFFIYHGKKEVDKVLLKDRNEIVKVMQSFMCVTKTSSTSAYIAPSPSTSSYAIQFTSRVQETLTQHQASSMFTSSYIVPKSIVVGSSYGISSMTQDITKKRSDIITTLVTTSAKIQITSICPTKIVPTPGRTTIPTTSRTITEQLNAEIEQFMKQSIESIAKNATKVQKFMQVGMDLLKKIDVKQVSTRIPTKLVKFLQSSLLIIGKFQTVGELISYKDKNAHNGMMVSTHNTTTFEGVHYQDSINNSISLPEYFFQSNISAKKAVVAVMEYPTLPVMIKLNETDGEDYICETSFLAAAKLTPSNDKRVISRFQISYSLKIAKEENAKYRCVFWEKRLHSNGSWSREGCQFVNISDRLVTCKCNHRDTLSFSVIRLKQSAKKKTGFSLDITTYIGCAVAGGVCVILLLIFIIFRGTLSYDHNVVHFNLAISIAASNGLYIAADFAFKIKYVCMGVSIGIMYFYLATLFWILVESFHLYMLVVRKSKDSNMIMFYMIIGWVVPSIVVAVTAAVERRYFLKEQFCWLTYDNWAIWTLVGPSLLIIFVSVVLLAVALSTSFKMERSLPGVHKFQRVAKLVFFLIPVIGISWSFSLLAVNEEKIIYQYVLTAVNLLIGLLAFTSYCYLNSGVENAKTSKTRKSMQSIRSASTVVMGKDNKGNDSSVVSLSIITEPAIHSKTNF